MPMVQFSLVSMLKLVDEKVISIERLVELMCHNPARPLYSTVLNENNTTEETQSADFIYQHPDNIPSKTLDFLIANRQADIPQKI